MNRRVRSFALAVAAGLVAWPAAGSAGYVTAAQLDPVPSPLKLITTDVEYKEKTDLYEAAIKLRNDGARFDGKLVVILTGLPAGVTQVNADGAIAGAPYTVVGDGLDHHEWLTVPLVFSNPTRAPIAFQPAVHRLVSGAVNARAIRGLSRPFTIAAIPDTQVYSEENRPEFKEQVDWVLAHAADLAFVTHLGDVVDNGTDAAQWRNAMAALTPLVAQDHLPFSIVRGNHDDPAFFLANLPLETMASTPWFVDAAPGGLSQAQIFRVEGAVLLHVGLQKDPTPSELAWANALLQRPELSGVPVVVSTHDFVDGSGHSPTGRSIWNGFVKSNPMVFMVLNGHTHTEFAFVKHDDANRPVYQMLSDYQDRAFGGNGLMRLVTIDPAASKISVKTFSPVFRVDKGPTVLDYFETDADSQFEYDVNVRERLAFDTTFDFGAEPPPPPPPPLDPIPAGVRYSHVFQNRRPLVGTTTRYAGTVDVQINENNPSLDYGGEATLTTDMDDNGSRVHAFLRFDDIVGTGPGQILPGSTILSAKLVFNATSSTKGKVRMHRMLVPWAERSTWMDFTPVDPVTRLPGWEATTYFNTDTGILRWITLPQVMVGGGVQADDVEAMRLVDAELTCPKPIPLPFVLEPGGYGSVWTPPSASGIPAEALTVDLTPAVQAWVNGEQENLGWFFEPTSSDGWDFQTAEGKQPPALVVEVAGAPLQQ